jgi:hypothetical protein
MTSAKFIFTWVYSQALHQTLELGILKQWSPTMAIDVLIAIMLPPVPDGIREMTCV